MTTNQTPPVYTPPPYTPAAPSAAGSKERVALWLMIISCILALLDNFRYSFFQTLYSLEIHSAGLYTFQRVMSNVFQVVSVLISLALIVGAFLLCRGRPILLASAIFGVIGLVISNGVRSYSWMLNQLARNGSRVGSAGVHEAVMTGMTVVATLVIVTAQILLMEGIARWMKSYNAGWIRVMARLAQACMALSAVISLVSSLVIMTLIRNGALPISVANTFSTAAVIIGNPAIILKLIVFIGVYFTLKKANRPPAPMQSNF